MSDETDKVTVAEALERARHKLTTAGLEDPRREARALLAHYMGVDPAMLIAFPEREVPDPPAFGVVLARRFNREPLSHITGRRDFWSLELSVSADVLDPRPDSETLVELALDHLEDHQAPLQLLDFGTGSGCLLLALLSELPRAVGVGVDRSETALAVARKNARETGMEKRAQFALSDWGAAVSGPFDLILSNPPYIPSADIEGLQPEVSLYEPLQALDGGEDGLDCYRTLLPQAHNLLKKNGLVVLEYGVGQARDVEGLLREHGFVPLETRRDLGGIERTTLARKSG